MLSAILLTAIILVSLVMVGVILLQRSEGGALGMGGGPSGFMTARGAGNLLTRITSILATAFFVLAILLTIVGNREQAARSIVSADEVGSIDLNAQQPQPTEQQPAQPAPAQPDAPSLDDLQALSQAPAAPPAQ
ncbi:preprotein translocase subunit SecG [Brevundimonas sp. 2R-24]|uniref:Protein-export membrane protein SecG n=1 Tax=Peiella sedimenti TaxID=3061083 RepID=A0ABT8SKB5_9CAUL|nr:preprotein translocase subunit SecG [Caulobacteraceae bacterium XZ-24]